MSVYELRFAPLTEDTSFCFPIWFSHLASVGIQPSSYLNYPNQPTQQPASQPASQPTSQNNSHLGPQDHCFDVVINPSHQWFKRRWSMGKGFNHGWLVGWLAGLPKRCEVGKFGGAEAAGSASARRRQLGSGNKPWRRRPNDPPGKAARATTSYGRYNEYEYS